MSEELLRALETRVDAVVRECRELRGANEALREASERRQVAAAESRREVEDTLRDLRSVLGSQAYSFPSQPFGGSIGVIMS